MYQHQPKMISNENPILNNFVYLFFFQLSVSIERVHSTFYKNKKEEYFQPSTKIKESIFNLLQKKKKKQNCWHQ